MPKALPAATVEFIRHHIDSVEKLEVLLLLSAAPERTWTVEQVYEQIRSNPDSIKRRLETLAAEGFLSVTTPADAYQFRPTTPALAAGAQQLARAYKEHRVTVIELIFVEPPSPIQGFADSFRIRKEEKDG